MTTLNKDRVELFLAALESGKYAQCAGKLRIRASEEGPEQNCALGVAIHVALDNGLRAELSWKWGHPQSGDHLFISGTLHPRVANWYGFDDPDPILIEPAGPYQLVTSVSRLNDDGKDFWTIAQMSREQWLKDQE